MLVAVDGSIKETAEAILAGGGPDLVAFGRHFIANPDEYRLIFSLRLEDVSGNRLGEALDHMFALGQRSRAGVVSFRPAP